MLFFSYLRFIRSSATFVFYETVGRGFSLAPPMNIHAGESNPKGLPYVTFITVVARRALPLQNRFEIPIR